MATVRRFRRANLRILRYHHFPEPGPATRAALARECWHIARHYKAISMDEVSECLAEKRPFPLNAVAVTVDGGYHDFYRNGFQIFREYNIPVLAYLPSGFLDGECWMWGDKVRYLFEQTQVKTAEIPGLNEPARRFKMTIPAERHGAIQKVLETARHLPEADRTEWLGELSRILDTPLRPRPPRWYAPISWEDARNMQRYGITFGAHPRSCVPLAAISDPAELEDEILHSRRRVEEMLQEPVRHFAYPNGGSEDMSPEAIAQVAAAGFETAVSLRRGLNPPGTDALSLKRIVVEPEMREFWFEEVVARFRLRSKGTF